MHVRIYSSSLAWQPVRLILLRATSGYRPQILCLRGGFKKYIESGYAGFQKIKKQHISIFWILLRSSFRIFQGFIEFSLTKNIWNHRWARDHFPSSVPSRGMQEILAYNFLRSLLVDCFYVDNPCVQIIFEFFNEKKL